MNQAAGAYPLLETRSGEGARPIEWAAQGSYACVWRGAWGRSGTACALKLPRKELVEAPDRLRTETEILARVSGPQVVRVLDQGERDGRPFLVLEWLDGPTLREHLTRVRTLPLILALEILESLTHGLVSFHTAGSPHGDIRPENLMLPAGRGAVLIDPGDPVGPDEPPPSPAEDVRRAALMLEQMLLGLRDAGRGLESRGLRPDLVTLWRQMRASEVDAAAAAAAISQIRTLL